MSKAAKFREQFQPWAGLAVGILGTGIAHQYGSDSVFNDCAVASPVIVVIAGLLGMAITVFAAFASWRVANDSDESPARRLIAIISVGMAAFFVMTLLLPLVAAMIIPPCFQ